VFRGVAFEFRFRDAEHKTFWDRAFNYGSAVATFAQGVVLGSFIQGYEVTGRAFSGGSFAFLTPFSLMTGVALLFGYGLLGAGWLVLKTEGRIQADARRHGRICLLGVLAAIAVVSIWTPLASQAVAARWFSWPNILILAPVPIATAVAALATWRALGSGAEVGPFAGAIVLFILSFAGIAISLYPMIVPYHFTLCLLRSHPGIPADRHPGAAAGDPDVLRMVVLGIPRQGSGGHRLSLINDVS
jgi:cytochrome d ubiquinol oxidase subunit II